MKQTNVSRFLADARQNALLRQQLKAAITIESCIAIAESYGHQLSGEELQAELDRMTKEELAELINPGVAPRLHIKPH